MAMARLSLSGCHSCSGDEVRMMMNFTAQPKSPVFFDSFSRWCPRSVLAGALLIALPAVGLAAPPSTSTINKLALNAYCSEAQSKSPSMADGSVSYKQVAELASNRALIEHPNVYRDSFAWKAKIVALLDQYGDEPIGQLCNEKPGPQS
jgi:hypothetical protein